MTVTVFTNPSNPQCEATEQELAKLGVRYDTVDLTKKPVHLRTDQKRWLQADSGRHLTELLMEWT